MHMWDNDKINISANQSFVDVSNIDGFGVI